MNVGVQVERADPGEMASLEGGGEVEIDGSAVAAEIGVMQACGLEGELERSRKRIPVSVERLGLGAGGQVYVEILSEQNTGKLRGRNRPGQVAVESGAAVQDDRKQSRAADYFDEWQPIGEAGCGY